MPRKKAKDYLFEELREMVRYIPESGEFFHRKTGEKIQCGGHNFGYATVRLFGVQFLAHRLAWLLMKGEWPKEQVDHINRVRKDNRWSNLRAASIAQNNANSIKSRPRSLPVGVRLNRNKTNPYMAVVSVGNRSQYIGSFATPERAHLAYIETKQRVHGSFSPFTAAAS